MHPLQAVDALAVRVLLFSVLALVLFALAGWYVSRDARSRGMNTPAAWGAALFLSLLLGTVLYYGPLSLVPGLLVLGLYVAVRE